MLKQSLSPSRKPPLHLSLAILACAALLASCDLLDREENDFDDVPPERLVAFTAVYAETDSGGAPIERVILADYEDPSVYKVISDPQGISRSGRFSPSKREILFGDRKNGSVHDPHFILARPDDAAGTPLMVQGLYERFPLTAPIDLMVWSPDEAGFFHTNPYQSVTGGQDLLYYSFAEEIYRKVRVPDRLITLYPVGLKGRDTLIVFSDELARMGSGSIGYYFMSFQGEYLDYIDNPRLEQINREGIIKKGAVNPSWQDELYLFAVAYHDSTFEGYKIAVTNLDGSHYREYTSGAYIDDHPRWGPDGKTILFDRIDLGDHTFTGYTLMEVNVETGEVREFARPETYGAIALWLPDY